MSQVAADRMSVDPAVAAGALIEAYRIVMGREPVSRNSWLFPLAQAYKAEGWAYNFNLGNITTFGSGDWYYNPHVTNGLKFQSYSTLLDGAIGLVKWMKRNGLVPYADAGDLAGYVAGLQRGNYLGTDGDYATYGRNIGSGVSVYANLLPVAYAEPTMSPLQAFAVGVGIVAVAGGIAYVVTMPRPRRARRRRLAYA